MNSLEISLPRTEEKSRKNIGTKRKDKIISLKATGAIDYEEEKFGSSH